MLKLTRMRTAFDRAFRNEQNDNLKKIEDATGTLESKMDALLSGNIDDAALQTDIEQKLNDLETQYAPKLTEVAAQLVDIAINVKNFGAVGDANYLNETDKKYYTDSIFTKLATDNTEAIQKALDYPTDFLRTIFIPDGTYMVNAAAKLSVKSNTKLVFSKNAKIVSMASWRDISSILDVVDVENVEIINPNLVGDRYLVSFTSEGAGHGISCRNVKKLTIKGGNVSNCFTDGIYLNNVKDVFIEDLTCDENRRQGMSLISAENFLCKNSTFKNTGGTSPSMGIDIEPNNTNEQLTNVVFENITTENNETYGIGINLNGLNNADTIIDVTVRNWTDNCSGSAFSAKYSSLNRSVSEASKINIVDLKAFNNKNCAITVNGYKADGSPRLIIDKPIIHNCNTSGLTNERFQNVAISVHTDTSGYPSGLTQGNVEIIEPYIDTPMGRTILRGIYIGYGTPYKKITIRDPLKINIGDVSSLSSNNSHNLIGFSETPLSEIFITDKFNVLTLTTSSTLVRNFSTAIYQKIVSTLPTGTCILRDWNRWGECTEDITVVFKGSNSILKIELPNNIQFIDETNSNVTGSYSTSQFNSVLKFKKVNDNMFKVIKEFGNWTIS